MLEYRAQQYLFFLIFTFPKFSLHFQARKLCLFDDQHLNLLLYPMLFPGIVSLRRYSQRLCWKIFGLREALKLSFLCHQMLIAWQLRISPYDFLNMRASLLVILSEVCMAKLVTFFLTLTFNRHDTGYPGDLSVIFVMSPHNLLTYANLINYNSKL